MTNARKIGLVGLATVLVFTAPIGVASAQTGAGSALRPGVAGAGLTSSQNQLGTGLPTLSGTSNMNITLEPTTEPLPQHTIKELEAPAATAIPPAAAAKPATCYYVDQYGVRHNEPCRQ